jgi:hypothetical protein
MSNLFDDEDVIFSYTRKQAIDDGVLVDITELAKEAGIRFPVAVTRGVFSILEDTSAPGQDFKGRTWDMLMVFRMHIRNTEGDEIHFAPLFLNESHQRPEPVSMWAKCGPRDEGEAVITIMLEGED